MKLTVDEKIFACFPGMKLAVVVARDIDNRQARPEILAELKEAWIDAGKAAAEYGNPQSHPQIKPWVERFKAIGVSRKDFPTAIESLVRRAGKGGEPMSINPLVDYYNYVSLRYIVPVGGYDIDQLTQGIMLRLSAEGDNFKALDDAERYFLPEGEVCYADGSTVLTRHFWKQSKEALILPETRNVVLVSEIPGELPGSISKEVLNALVCGVEKYFITKARAYMIEESNTKDEIDLYLST